MNELDSSQNEKPIYAYDNYRLYLQYAYRFRKARNANFSFRSFAMAAGFKSPSFLKLVMDGKSNLSVESAEKFSKALKHNKSEAQYFRLLVQLNQSKTSEEKQRHSAEILKLRTYRKIHPLSESYHRYISRWYFVVIKEMVDLPDFREDPHWIAAKLDAKVPAGEVRRAIEEMIDIGILTRTPDGQLTQAKVFLMTPNEVISGSAAEYHRSMIAKAAEAIDKIPRERRELSGLTLCISKETALKIKTMVQEFREQIMAVCTEDLTPESVYQVNLHLFPLVESEENARKNADADHDEARAERRQA